MSKLYQPILTADPEPYHDPEEVLTLAEFLELLRQEEDYYDGEQHHTKIMITRLRKVFYDQWGWNSQLICEASEIKGRYVVKVIENADRYADYICGYHKKSYQSKHRVVMYSDQDKVYGNMRAGEVPFIYQNDHQEVRLPEGYMCDVAHILAGLDACNHPQIVSPLPRVFSVLKNFFPYVDSNMDIVTWLGDIASASADFLFDYFRNNEQPLSTAQEQNYINLGASGSDMLGDIDPYVIARHYDINTLSGDRVSDILADYYRIDNPYRRMRFSLFCQEIGLGRLINNTFENESEWLTYYTQQLTHNLVFQFFSLADMNLSTMIRLFEIWFNGYEEVFKKEILLQNFIKALKELIVWEQKEDQKV